MEPRQRLVDPTIRQALADVASALDHAHAQGVAHRDLKPSNVLVRRDDGRALLTDFGLARSGFDADLTRTERSLGTFAYISPEQCRPGRAVTASSDIYSFAAILFEVACGRPPYCHGLAAIAGHLADDRPVASVRDVDPDLPRALDDAVSRGLAREPENRFASAGALASTSLTATAPIARQPAARTPRPTAKARRRPVKALLIAAAFAVTGVVTTSGAVALHGTPSTATGRAMRLGRRQVYPHGNEKIVYHLDMPPRGPGHAERVIQRFGGQTALARLLGRRQSTVEHWAATGRIPAQWHEPLMALARERGIILEARDFVEGQVHVIRPAGGRLGVLMVGLGAVASTFVAGVELVRRGHARPYGSVTQMGTIRLGRRTEQRVPRIRDLVPLADLDQLVFGAWDPIADNAYQAAVRCGVLDRLTHLEPIAAELSELEPMPAAFDRTYVRRLDGPNVKAPVGKRRLVEAIRADIRDFKDAHACDRLVMIWCASTEVFLQEADIHRDPDSFARALEADDPRIPPSMLYAYAALMEGVPFINGAPNLTVDISAMEQLAVQHEVPISGKDFKTGQTLVKTVIAPMLKARMLGLRGWYSTNILGNRDGEVLDDPDSFRTKEETKLGVLEHILQPDLYPELYGDVYHKVRINYYPPRGDSKEGWDNVDLFGWLGYPMQIKIDFLCRDSILAAPIVLDLVLFTDLAQRAGMHGIQEWLSFYFKSPQHAASVYPEHDLFIQQTKLKNTLRWLMGEDQITHLGRDYYQSV